MDSTIYFLAALIILFLVFIYLKSFHNYWKRKGVPYKKPIFMFGNLKDSVLLKKNQAECLNEVYKSFQNEKFFGFYYFLNPAIVFRDPELLKHVLIKDFQHFEDRMKFSTENNPLLQHLITLRGDKWKFMRNKLSPTFTSGKMKMMFPLVLNCAEKVSHLFGKSLSENEIDIKDFMARYTLDSIGSCAFGFELNSVQGENSEFRKFGNFIFNPSIISFAVFMVNEFSNHIMEMLKLKVMPEQQEKLFLSTFKKTLEKREKFEVYRQDFIQMLMELKRKGVVRSEVGDKEDNQEELKTSNHISYEMTDTLLASQALLFLIAGFETSSLTLTYALYYLAFNQDVQDRLRSEISEVLQKHGGITYESLQDMKYMGMVIDETLRLNPPAPTILREVTKPYTIPGTTIQLDIGTKVKIPIFAIHRDPEHYSDPENFDPEHFSEENKSSRHNFAYLPFGDGPRMCLGMRFAQMQMRAALSYLIPLYEFQTSNNTPPCIEFNPMAFLSSQPKNKIFLRVKGRL